MVLRLDYHHPSTRGDHCGEAPRAQLRHSSRPLQAVADLAVPAGLIVTVTTEGLEIAGRRVVEAFPVVVVLLVVVLLVEEAVARAQMGLVAGIQTTMEDVALVALAEGDRVVRLVSQVAGAEEEEVPPATATTADDEVVGDVLT